MTDCATCDGARVLGAGAPPHDVDIAATTDRLGELVASGRMRFLRGDVPLSDMTALFSSDLKYTIVSFLECLDCGRTLFWGLCVRGAPILEHVDPSAPAARRWDPVPPRERWARS